MKSIDISRIGKDNCYFNPGCAFFMYKPEVAEKLLSLLNRYFGPVKQHDICCHHDPKLPNGSVIINNCAGCDRRFRSLYKGIRTISLWEVLDSIDDLPLPDYSGISISVHDSCSFRQKPQVHAAVRGLLHKMNIKVVDSEFSGTKSICCGDNLYPRVPVEEVIRFQKKRAAQMPCEDVAVYCVSCIKSMAVGGKKPHHMVDLLLNEPTQLQEMRIEVYHEALNRYIEAH